MVADEQLQGRAQLHAQQPEAEQAGQPADADQAVGQALQQPLVPALQPALAEFRQHLRQAARQQIEQRLAPALQPVLQEFHQHLRRDVRQQIGQEVGPIGKEFQPEVLQAHEPSRQEEPQVQLGLAEGQQAIQGLQPGLFRGLLYETRGLVEQQGEHWLERMVPSEVRAHLRASQREQLLALRAWLDVAIQRIEKSECPRRPESAHIE